MADLQTNLQRLENNSDEILSLVDDISDAIIAKGGTVPANTGLRGFANAINSIPSGGGGGDTTDVRFIDYDGTVVQSYSAADFANLTELPANPSHTGLTAQGWNWSLADAKAYVADYGKLDIGQMYITSDGKTRFYFTATKDSPTVDLYLNLSDDTELDIDWGDKSAHTTWTSADGGDSKSHEYTSAGRYVIAITVITGEFGLSYITFPIHKIEIGDGYTSIDSHTFSGSHSLSSVTIPSSVTSIGDNAFSNCLSLSSITIPDSVTSIGEYAFDSCNGLSSVAIPNSVTSIGDNAFSNCVVLSFVAIPDSITSISDYAFNGCCALISVTIPDSITSIGDNAFNECRALSSITIPNSVTSIVHAFSGCYALVSVTIPNSVTSIGDYVFCDCQALSSVTIPDSITSIGDNAFSYCYALSSVTIPNSVTSIGPSAFYCCYSLSSITIPDSITSIGDYLFSDCEALSSITFESSTPPELYGDLAIPYTCIIRVPQGSLSAYTSAENYPDLSKYIYEEY